VSAERPGTADFNGRHDPPLREIKLSVRTFLNGAFVSDARVLDTSTTTIDDLASDTWGNTATAIVYRVPPSCSVTLMGAGANTALRTTVLLTANEGQARLFA
jgi:hypothetical protein